MDAYAPIHPERPLARTAVALAVSLGVHAVALGVIVAWAFAAAVAAKRAEPARPKEVSLATLDAEQWEANRRLVERAERVRPIERILLDDTTKELPREGTPGRRQDGKEAKLLPGTSPRGWAAEEGMDAPAPNLDPSAGRAPAGPMLDLRPVPPAGSPRPLTFTPVGDAGIPQGEGTTFMNLTVGHPDAWRFTIFFNRSVEHMDAVYRYELGAPVPQQLVELFRARQARGACSTTAVKLDRNGKLIEASVRRSSGIPELDQIILEAIRRTSPYVNLPQGILDESGFYSDSWGLCIVLR